MQQGKQDFFFFISGTDCSLQNDGSRNAAFPGVVSVGYA